jgi:hypothetical protein
VYVAKRFVTYECGIMAHFSLRLFDVYQQGHAVAGIGSAGGLIAQRAEIFALQAIPQARPKCRNRVNRNKGKPTSSNYD